MVQAEEKVAGTSTGDSSATTVTESTQAPPSEGEAKTEEAPDYKVLYEQGQERLSKAEGDLKSMRGTRTKQADVAAAIREHTDELLGQRKLIDVLARGASGDGSVDVAAELSKVNQDRVLTHASNRAQTEAQNLFEVMEEAYTADDGTSLLEGDMANEFAEVLEAWRQGADVNSTRPMEERMGYLRAAAIEANKVRRRVDREITQKATSVADRAAAGSDLDLHVDGSSAGGSVSDDEWMKRYGRGESDDHKKAREISLKREREN